MNTSEEYPSIHRRLYPYQGRQCTLFEIVKALPSNQQKQIISHLKAQGIAVEDISVYEYGSADTLRHVFVRMKGADEDIPYFMLDKDVWNQIVTLIVSVHFSPNYV